jgi:hypothetical protein
LTFFSFTSVAQLLPKNRSRRSCFWKAWKISRSSSLPYREQE